jgi:hypothetical protein
MLPPDAAPPAPDVAPDVAPPPPDVAPDVAPPTPDVAYDTQSLGSDARLATFSISPNMHDFGALLIGDTSPAFNFTVTNNGDLPSDTPTIDATGDFVISTNGCNNPVLAGKSCLVGVSFKPQAAGARSGLMHAITSMGATAGVSLTGTGMAPAPAQFALSALSATFWAPEGHSTAQAGGDVVFTLTNMGGSDSAVPTISFGGKDATSFGVTITRIMPRACPNALAPGVSCTIPVHFAPAAMSVPANALSQPFTGTLDISGNPGGSVSATLTGNATLSRQLLITPGGHDFGTLKTGGTSGPFTFTVTNTGTGAVSALTFNYFPPIVIGPPPPVFFGFDDSDCTTRAKGFLDIGASCTVNATFVTPTAPAGLKQKLFEVSGSSRSMPNVPAQATAEVQGTQTP